MTVLFLCVFLLATATGSIAVANDGPDPSQLIDEIRIETNVPDLPAVNITIGEAKHLFIVDTGSAHSTFDLHLANYLGGQVPETQLRSKSGGERPSPMYNVSPGLSVAIGKVKLKCRGPFHCEDLSAINRNAEFAFSGILGMDMLQDFVLQIDYDSQVIRLLRPMNDSPGTRLPLEIKQSCPYVLATYGDDLPAQFLVDTGATIG